MIPKSFKGCYKPSSGVCVVEIARLGSLCQNTEVIR